MIPKKRPTAGVTAAAKMGATVSPPGGHHWTLWRLSVAKRTNPETGKSRKQTLSERMRGDAGADGVVCDVWPASEFRPADVLARWGAGRYRVDWFSVKNDRLGTEVFEVSDPKPGRRGGSKVAPQRDDDDEPQGSAREQAGIPNDPWSLMMFMQQREEAAAERERVRAEAQRERDRDFFQQLQTQNMQMLQIQAQKAPAPEGAAASAELQRREMAVTMAEMTLKMEKRLAAALEGFNDRDDDDDDDPPKSIEDAGKRIGMKLLSELETKAPDLIEGALPRIATWLESKGFKPSDDLADDLAAIKAAKGRKRNGAVQTEE
jgi:hypothetical protein